MEEWCPSPTRVDHDTTALIGGRIRGRSLVLSNEDRIERIESNAIKPLSSQE
jgi:hypothetical protein